MPMSLLLLFTSGGAPLSCLYRRFPCNRIPIASCSCMLIHAAPWVSCGNICRLQFYFLIKLLRTHPVHIASRKVVVGGRHWLAQRSLENTGWIDEGCCFFFLRILSYNNLTRLDEGSLADLGGLHVLRLSHNSINHIAEGAFKGLKNLRVL